MGKRSERLLALMQALRRRRRPVAGQVLAEEMGVSLRSLYRDIETLKSMGAAIDGEAGIGFQLRADYFMPPLMFTSEELEAVALGLRTLIFGPDSDMARTARDAITKIAVALPAERRAEMDAIGLFALPRQSADDNALTLADLRLALREEVQVFIAYEAADGDYSERVIYPVALGYDRNPGSAGRLVHAAPGFPGLPRRSNRAHAPDRGSVARAAAYPAPPLAGGEQLAGSGVTSNSCQHFAVFLRLAFPPAMRVAPRHPHRIGA